MTTPARRRYEAAVADYRRELARCGEALASCPPDTLPPDLVEARAGLVVARDRFLDAAGEEM